MKISGRNKRDLATIVAALRYWQREGWRSVGHEHEIASSAGTLTPLSDSEIDQLCNHLIDGSSLESLPSEAPTGFMPEMMTEELKDKAVDEVFDFAFRALQRFGRLPDDSRAEDLIQAIGAYLGEPEEPKEQPLPLDQTSSYGP